MKEHNDNEYKDEENKFGINDEDVIENYDLENDFEPKDEIFNFPEPEFQPHDEDDYLDKPLNINFEPRDEEISKREHSKEKKEEIISLIKSKCESSLIKKKSTKPRIHHPNLKDDYFKKIDTKEKAYWLGFIYADGCIVIDKRHPGTRRLTIRIDKKDEILINRFAKAIRFNLLYKKYEEKNNIIGIQIGNKKLTRDLISHGVIPRKSKKIELPTLLNRKLDLAFLLGFFDGDGTQGTTKITSGSKKFVEQIKTKYDIDNKIHPKYGKGMGYDFYLGGELFNEMLDNYKKSLGRKRCRFSTENERITNIRKKVWKGGHERKLKLTKEELENLVWKIPKTVIANNNNVSDRTIGKWCKTWDINTPPRGYWSKKDVKEGRE